MPIGRLSRRLILRDALPFVTWEGVFAAVFISLTGSPFLIGFALFLGANDFEIGLLAAIPFLAQVAQLPAAYRIDISGRCKTITIRSLLLARQLWWLLVPLPFLKGEWRLACMLMIFIISSIGTTAGAVGWFTWVADLIPARIRGRYFGFRSASVALSTVITFLLAGGTLDFFKSCGQQGFGFALLIAIAGISALLAAHMMYRLPEGRIAATAAAVGKQYFLEPLSSSDFKNLLAIFFVWNIGTGIAAAFFAVHMLTNLQMTFTQISFYSAASLIAAILANKPWGALIDRHGSKPIIVVSALGLSIVPLIWLIPRADSLWILGFESIYAGVLWAGFNLASFNIPLALSPNKNRTVYLATFAVASGMGFFISSLIGGALAEHWGDIRFVLGPQVIVNYHILFIISAIIRGIGAIMTLGIREPCHNVHFSFARLFEGRIAKD